MEYLRIARLGLRLPNNLVKIVLNLSSFYCMPRMPRQC